MFAGLPRNTLRGLANIAQQQQFAARTVIVRQGIASGMFYIIGRAAPLCWCGPRRAATSRPASIRSRSSAQGPPASWSCCAPRLEVADVVSLTPLVALALPHAAVQAFLLGDGQMARGLEQVGTGRLIALRKETGM